MILWKISKQPSNVYTTLNSYYVYAFGVDCDRLDIDDQEEICSNACERDKSFFRIEDDTEFGRIEFEVTVNDDGEEVGTITSKESYWIYEIPASKPSLQERLDGADSGRFFFDTLEVVTDSTAANFVVDIFTEYMNCAVSKI